jgi:hypothetical protein
MFTKTTGGLVAACFLFASAAFGQVTMSPWGAGNAYVERTQILDLLGDRANQCQYAHKIDDWDSGDMNGPYSGMVSSAGDPLANVITILNSDGTYFDWQSLWPVCAVIVKGGNNANVYLYDPAATSGSGLHAPANQGGNIAAVSHVTFVFGDPDEVQCWKGETAWSAGPRYTNRGSWATYTAYTGTAKTVTLYAGQTFEAGTAHLSDPVNGHIDITIALAPNFRFKEVQENVKIQDYATAPTGNPSPGGFAHKRTAAASPFTVTVPQNNFYGIHLDVERQIPCPVTPLN